MTSETTRSDDTIHAPFTQEQCDKLNRFQKYGFVHEFTCGSGNRTDAAHLDGNGTLLALPRGWVCPYCDYTQDWAHIGMLEELEHPFPNRRPSPAEGETPETDAFRARCGIVKSEFGWAQTKILWPDYVREAIPIMESLERRLRASQPVAEGVGLPDSAKDAAEFFKVAEGAAYTHPDGEEIYAHGSALMRYVLSRSMPHNDTAELLHKMAGDFQVLHSIYARHLTHEGAEPDFILSQCNKVWERFRAWEQGNPAPAPLTPENVQAMIDAGRDEPNVETYASTDGPAPAPEGGTLPPGCPEKGMWGQEWHGDPELKWFGLHAECKGCKESGCIPVEIHPLGTRSSLRAADLGRGAKAALMDWMRLPPAKHVNSACMSYRHDFGLLSAEEQKRLRYDATEWLYAWAKEMLEPPVEPFAALLRAAPQLKGGEA